MSWLLERDLGDLDGRLSTCMERWKIRIGSRLGGGHRSGIFECRMTGGEEAVLKLTPTSREAQLEATALTLWGDRGASARLLDAALADGALLLHRIRPATPLRPDNENAAVAVAADLLPRLHLPVLEALFPTLSELYPFLAAHSSEDLDYERRTRGEPHRGEVALELLPVANAAATRLCDTTANPMLLHGDFIDKNLLLDGNRYVSVDPIPRVGDPSSDVGFFAHEHRPAEAILTRSRALAEATGNDPLRSQRWAAIWTVLVAVSAWRDDQERLEELIISPEFSFLLGL